MLTEELKYFNSLSFLGIRTGKCVSSSPSSRGNKSEAVCEIYGWCPTELTNDFKHNTR